MLIDKLNYHQFQPPFYQVATSQLEPSSISFSLLQDISKKEKILEIRMAEALRVDATANAIHTNYRKFHLRLSCNCKRMQNQFFRQQDD